MSGLKSIWFNNSNLVPIKKYSGIRLYVTKREVLSKLRSKPVPWEVEPEAWKQPKVIYKRDSIASTTIPRWEDKASDPYLRSQYKKDYSSLFGIALRPPIPKKKKAEVYDIEDPEAGYGAPGSWHEELLERLSLCYQEYSPEVTNKDFIKKIEIEAHADQIFKELEELYVNDACFPFLISRFITYLLKRRFGDEAFRIFSLYCTSLVDNPTLFQATSPATLYMFKTLRKHFSEDLTSVRLEAVYRHFKELDIVDTGEMEASLSLSYAKAGNFDSSRVHLLRSISTQGYFPYVSFLNTLLQQVLCKNPIDYAYADTIVQFMDFFFPPSHLSQKTLTSQTSILRLKLCKTVPELSEFIELVDRYLLLENHELQALIIKNGVNLLKKELATEPEKLLLLQGWLNRLRRRKISYRNSQQVRAMLPISPYAEFAVFKECCFLDCPTGALKLSSSILSNSHISSKLRSLVISKTLEFICEHPQIHHLGLKKIFGNWIANQFYISGTWKIDSELRYLVLRALSLLQDTKSIYNIFENSELSNLENVDLLLNQLKKSLDSKP